MRSADQPRNVIVDVPEQAGIINRQDGEIITSGINSSGASAPENYQGRACQWWIHTTLCKHP